MSANFDPQFHKKIMQIDDSTVVWVALPHPPTLIPGKTVFYRTWQTEERQKLQQTGDIVLAIAISN